MKRYTVPAGRANEPGTHSAPERTAGREASTNFASQLWGSIEFQVWPSRAAMARSIRMQEKAGTPNRWRAVVALRETEGY